MQYIDQDIAQKVMEAVIAHLDQFSKEKFGEGFAEDLMENQSTVLAGMANVDFDDTNTSSTLAADVDSLETIYEEMSDLPMPDASLATEVAEFWTEVERQSMETHRPPLKK